MMKFMTILNEDKDKVKDKRLRKDWEMFCDRCDEIKFRLSLC